MMSVVASSRGFARARCRCVCAVCVCCLATSRLCAQIIYTLVANKRARAHINTITDVFCLRVCSIIVNLSVYYIVQCTSLNRSAGFVLCIPFRGVYSHIARVFGRHHVSPCVMHSSRAVCIRHVFFFCIIAYGIGIIILHRLRLRVRWWERNLNHFSDQSERFTRCGHNFLSGLCLCRDVF